MSVQMNYYVMYGVIVPFAQMKARQEDLEPYMDSAFEGIHHHDGICVLFDGMQGKYVAIGRVLAKSGNHEVFNSPVEVQDGEIDDGAELQEKISALAGTPKTLGYLFIAHYR